MAAWRTLATGIVADDSRGLAWIGNQIVFAPDPIRGLFTDSADGGTPTVLTEPDVAKDERTHRWPAPVFGQNAVLFTVGASNKPDDYDGARIEALRLDGGERVTVMEGASLARHLPNGRLIFARGGALYSVAFDARSLKRAGRQTVVEQGIGTDFTSGAAHFSVSHNDTLFYVNSGTSDNQRLLFSVDRKGTATSIDLPPAIYSDPRFSPDGSKLAVIVGPSGGGDVYSYDVGRGTFVRLTFDGRNATPIWSADGQQVDYASFEPMRRSHVMRKPADGSRRPYRLHSLDSRIYLANLLDPDTIIGYIPDLAGPPPRRSDIVKVRLASANPPTAGRRNARPGLRPGRLAGWSLSRVPERRRRPSGNLRPGSVRQRRAVAGVAVGGEEPRWSRDGKELYFRSGSQLMVMPVA